MQVGDYVLSPDIVVERKSVSDLFGSFADGRLYTQVESMSKHYRYCCLLIEFSGESYFYLQNAADISPKSIDTKEISSKLAILALAFPTLRILWSRSPQNTVDIFRSIATGHPNPDPDSAADKGAGSGLGAMADDEDEHAGNRETALSMLQVRTW